MEVNVFDVVKSAFCEEHPWTVSWYIRWLEGTERADCSGTVGVCRCRPSVTTARRVFMVLQWVLLLQDLCQRTLRYVKQWFSAPQLEDPFDSLFKQD